LLERLVIRKQDDCFFIIGYGSLKQQQLSQSLTFTKITLEEGGVETYTLGSIGECILEVAKGEIGSSTIGVQDVILLVGCDGATVCSDRS
jgi:hypothetical protein